MRRISNLLPWLVAALMFGLIAVMVIWVTPMKAVASGSMEPTLPTGSRILIHEEPHYEAGEIITFYADDREVVTHRLMSIASDGSFTTKGDANPTPDVWNDPVTSDDVIGKVVYMTPITTSAFWGSWLGFVVIVCLIVMTAAALWPEDDESSTNQQESDLLLSSV